MSEIGGPSARHFFPCSALFVAMLVVGGCDSGGSGASGDTDDDNVDNGSGDGEEVTRESRVFRANDGVSGSELWITDGTAAGTELLVDINSGSGSSSPAGFTSIDGQTYFRASDGADGVEPWVTDENAAGTMMLKDINPGGDSFPTYFTEFRNRVYFVADDGSGEDVWRTDGTPEGTEQVTTDAGLTDVNYLEVVDLTLFFVGTTSADGAELWRTDGTVGGERQVLNLAGGADSGVSVQGGAPTRFNGQVYFRGQSTPGSDELWRSDGLADNTVQVSSIRPGDDAEPGGLTVYDGELYFAARDGTNNEELYKVDINDKVTQVMEFDPSSSGFVNDITRFDQALFMVARGSRGNELWKSRGTAASTAKVADINGTVDDSLPVFPELTVVDDRLYFIADEGSGEEVWQTDGSIGIVQRVMDVNPSGSSNPEPLGELNGELLFRADDGNAGAELWKSTDGTPDGTAMVMDINAGAGDSDPYF